jgi:DNA invertase Pin-like site-specific DNA recombinase
MNRAAIYARFSTDQQREASIDDQIRTCTRVGTAAGLEIVATFNDRGIGGGTADRPGYQALLAAARRGEFTVIVAEDISRLWRSRAEYGPRSAELEDLECHLVTCVGDDTRREGWGLVLGIKQAIAESVRREISYRTRRGLEGLALAGKSTGGRCYGYGAPQEAATVLRIFTRRASGRSLAAIAQELTASGVAAPRGGAWGRSTVAAILANERYTGAVTWGKTEGRGGAADSRLRRRVIRSGGPLVARSDEKQRIVTDVLFQAAKVG